MAEDNPSAHIYPRLQADYSHSMYEGDEGLHIGIDLPFDLPEENTPIKVPLFGDLQLVFALDQGKSYDLLLNSLLKLNPNLSPEKLRELSIANMLRAVGDKIEVRGTADDLVMVTAGGNFEATLILVDDIFQQFAPQFGGEVWVAVPANDLLFMARPGSEKLAEAVERTFAAEDASGLLSKGIFSWKNGDWSLVSPK